MSNNPTNKECVLQQYSDDRNLSARMSLHTKHSTNKQGLISWLWEQYRFFAHCRILELGCGNGAQWEDKVDTLPYGCEVILSDLSDGMVRIVKEKYSEYKLTFQQIDIQKIPYANDSFDFIIANHMLYHVPDLTRALSEVKRVLKTNGILYSTTIGSGGLQPFLHSAFKRFDSNTEAFAQKFSFIMQNGYEVLNEHFVDVKRVDYEDSFSITETQDLIDWIESTITIGSYSQQSLDSLYGYFEDIRKRDGAINIPKEVGLFISQNKQVSACRNRRKQRR